MAPFVQPAPSTRCALERQRAAWIVLCGLVLFGALATPFFMRHVYTSDDLAAFHLPLRAFYARCLQAGERFEWMPGLFAGYYVHGEGQGGFYHPWHVMLYENLPLRAAFGWELLASYPLLALGVYVFLRRQRLRRDAAAFGALLAASSGFCLLHFMHTNAVAVWAHVPWLLVAMDGRLKAVDRRAAARWELAVALLVASQLLLGYPQYVWMSLVVAAVFVGWRAGFGGASPGAVAWLVGAALVGALVASVQLVPTLEALRNSTRSAVGAEFAMWGSLHPANLVQLVAPYALAERVVGGNTHELGIYCGAVPLTLIVWLLAARPRLGPGVWQLAIAAGLIAGAGLWLALGQYGGLYRAQTWLPLVGSFRFPCRYIALVHFGVAILGAIAFGALARRATRGVASDGRQLIALTLPVAAAVVVLAVLLIKPHGLELAGWPLLAAGPLLLAVAVGLVLAADRGARWALPALAVFAMCDAGAYGLSYAVAPHHAPLEEVAAAARPDVEPRQRVVADLAPFDRPARHRGNQLLLVGWQRADGYAGLAPARQLDYTRPSALRVAGVGWIGALAAPRVAETSTVDRDWSRLSGALPRFRLLADVRVSRNPVRDLEKIDPAVTALVDAADAVDSTAGNARSDLLKESEETGDRRSIPRGEGMVGYVAAAEDVPGSMRLLTDAPGPRLLVVAESFHGDWQSKVDGRPTPTVRVYGDFFGCFVPRGQHEVEFTFLPRSLAVGRAISVASLSLLLSTFLIRSYAPVGWRVPR